MDQSPGAMIAILYTAYQWVRKLEGWAMRRYTVGWNLKKVAIQSNNTFGLKNFNYFFLSGAEGRRIFFKKKNIDFW